MHVDTLCFSLVLVYVSLTQGPGLYVDSSTVTAVFSGPQCLNEVQPVSPSYTSLGGGVGSSPRVGEEHWPLCKPIRPEVDLGWGKPLTHT